MPIFFDQGKSLLYIHIPKTGGSSVETILTQNGYKSSFRFRGFHPRDLTFIKCSPQHFHAELISKLFYVDQFDKVFTIIRDPFERIKSEYYWQRHLNIAEKRPTEWLRSIFHNYETNPYIFDNHIRPQVDFIVEQSTIFKLEEDGINKAIRFALDQDDTVSKDNSISKRILKNVSIGKNRSGRIVHKKKTAKEAEIENEFFSIRDTIYDFYEQDYECFGYQMF